MLEFVDIYSVFWGWTFNLWCLSVQIRKVHATAIISTIRKKMYYNGRESKQDVLAVPKIGAKRHGTVALMLKGT